MFGVVVHTTGRSPVLLSKQTRRPAIQEALDVYYRLKTGTHYVIEYDGTIHAVVPENRISSHAGWGTAGRRRWASWTAPTWWSSVWQRWNARIPADLLPKGAPSPNQVYIGVELLGNETASGFTPAQYDALARLVVDIARRHGIAIPSAPSPRLLGHEDVDPIARSNRYGGWDPGAHRNRGIKPVFSWPGLWSRMQALGGGAAPATGAPAGDAARPFLKATGSGTPEPAEATCPDCPIPAVPESVSAINVPRRPLSQGCGTLPPWDTCLATPASPPPTSNPPSRSTPSRPPAATGCSPRPPAAQEPHPWQLSAAA